MDTRSAYRRRNTISLRLQKRMAVAVFAGLAAGVSVLALMPSGRMERVPADSQALPPLAKPQTLTAAETRAKPRRIFPYSIVPGGVASKGDLLHMVKTDEVVKRHYAGFAVDKATAETVTKPRAVYVSYRKGDQVYWTANKVMLREGETVLSDGNNLIRGRCGNRISDKPRLPVEQKGPSETELDSSTEDDIVDTSYNAAMAMPGGSYPLTTFPTGTGESAGGGGQTSDPFPTPVPASGVPLFPGVNGGSETPPTGTVTPVVPNTPLPPVAPVTPTTPVTPNTPVTPVTPVAPTTPVTPEAPVTPNTPGTPVVPGTPDTPVNPPSPPLPPLPWPPQLPPSNPPATTQPPPNDVPEPGTLWLGGIGLAALLLRRRR
jgi:hypothetical protein